MKLIRSDVRHVCFKRKAGFRLETELAQEVYKQVEPILEEKGWRWEDFTKVWDVAVKTDSIIPVVAIKDLNAVMEVAAKVELLVSMGVEKEWDPEELAIIHAIESQFLDGLMSWANYKKDWNIRWDYEFNRITAALIREPDQIHLTKEEVDKRVWDRLQANAAAAKENPHKPLVVKMDRESPPFPKKKPLRK